jgi:hypothetical protein
MGMIVECNGQELWFPSLRVGNLFFAQIQSLEQALDIKSGVDTFIDDILEIDLQTFNLFVKAALHKLETNNNGPLFAMTAGCLEIAIAINAQITGEWPEVSEKLKPLVLKAKTVMNAIP